MPRKSSLVALALAAIVFGSVGAATAQADVVPRITKATEVTTVTAIRYVEIVASFKLPGQALQLTATDEASAQALQVAALTRADQYALHQLARNRPEVTPQWRRVASV